MKRIIFFLGMLAVFGLAYGKPIDESTAKYVGQSFLKFESFKVGSESFQNESLSIDNLQLVYKANSSLSTQPALFPSSSPKTAETLFYVFNISTNGYIIVAGDDNVTPILAYSNEATFNPNNIPSNVGKWLEKYKDEIRYIIENKVKPTNEISNKWEYYGAHPFIPSHDGNNITSIEGVNPLVQTKWDQSPYYNDLCPYDNQNNDRTVTGCVATAMAQIMKFWKYPVHGEGFHSFDNANYGTLSANYGSTTYEWNSMPNSIASANTAIATLMYQVGVSVDMNYGVGSTGGSSAYVISAQSPVTNCSEYALKTYFGYKSSLQGLERAKYSDSQWISMLKTELNAGRPVLYDGFGNGGGHCFVADGYDNNDFIHFNWGWSGAYDGFFQIDALNPSGTGTGGGTGGFNSGQQAVIGIEPASTQAQTFNMALYNYVTPSATTLNYGQAFSIATNIVNSGTNIFNGDYCAAVFDAAFTFVDFVEVKTGATLKGGDAYTNDLVFSNTGLLSMLPGTYYVSMFYRPTGGNWVEIADNGNYTNAAQINVVFANDIELYSDISVTPGTTLTNGKPASVNLNIINNNGTTTFVGQYGVALYNLDGTLAQTIAVVNETNGLPPGYTYQSPYVTFATQSVTAGPGTYLLALLFNYNNTGWQLAGSSFYQNPIKVTVQESELQPDKYEPNNTVQASYSLPISFTGNSTDIRTTGSNCHTGSDYDFYKIIFPPGYIYSVTPTLFDLYKSDNGNKYTLEALVSFSNDASNWSDAYDDLLSINLTLKGGETLYMIVAPYFSGSTGTYLLDLNITRSKVDAIEDNSSSEVINIYPNPAEGYLTVDLSRYSQQVNKIQVLNLQGQKMSSINVEEGQKTLNLSFENYSKGLYLLQLFTKDGIINKKIIGGR